MKIKEYFVYGVLAVAAGVGLLVLTGGTDYASVGKVIGTGLLVIGGLSAFAGMLGGGFKAGKGRPSDDDHG